MKDDSIFLKRVMRQYLAGIATPHIVDVPCGDMAWMPNVLDDVAKDFPKGLRYTGLDIVPEAVAANTQKLGGDRGGRVTYEFSVFDVTSNMPPTVDMLICRDLVNHLATKDIQRLLRNLRESGTRYLVISNNRNPDDGGPGEWGPFARDFGDVGGSSRHLDITKRPFSFGAPIVADSHLSVWENTPAGWRRRR